MKRVISSLFILVLLSVIAWGMSSWLLGARAEQELRTYLAHAEQVPGERLFRYELLELKRTLTGAQAIVLVSSDFMVLDNWLNDLRLRVKMTNGPILFQGDEPRFGSSMWQLFIDQGGNTQAANDVDSRDNTPETNRDMDGAINWFDIVSIPFASVHVDFSHQADYQINLFVNTGQQSGHLEITGRYDLESDDNRGRISMQKVNIDQPLTIKIPQGRISFDLGRNITAGYKPGVTHMALPEVFVAPTVIEPLMFRAKADSALQTDNNGLLDSLIRLEIDEVQMASNKQPYFIDALSLELKVHQLAMSGLIKLSESHAEIDNLQQQVEWSFEENSEFPEGQEQIRQLYEQISVRKKRLPRQIARQIFSSENSSVKIDIKMKSRNGVSKLSGQLGLNDQVELTEHLFNLLKGEARLTLQNDVRHWLVALLPADHRADLMSDVDTFELRLSRGKLELKPVIQNSAANTPKNASH